MNDEDFLKKLREAFAIEAEEHLQAITTGLLEIEKKPAAQRQKELVEVVFREAHSLKGAARAVNRTDIEGVCQALEGEFSGWKSKGVRAGPEVFDTLNAALDFVAKLRTQSDIAPAAPIREMVQRIARAGAAAHAAPPVPPPPPVSATPGPEPERQVIAETVRVPMARMDILLRKAEEMVTLKLAADEHALELRELAAALESWRKEWEKVRATRSESGVREYFDQQEGRMRMIEKKVAGFKKTAEHDQRLISSKVDDLLGNAKKLVMLPFAGLLDLFPKLVRDLARSEGKEVELIIRGREVEIDKRILEEIKDALIHLVRNAVDHGLENPEPRVARGKRAQGTVTIAVAQREGNKVEIVVADDGAGIDLAQVKVAAVKSGAISAAEAARLGDAAAGALIFQSGVSTSPLITEISGRGLGMAIVREKVERLGGKIAIESKPGVGTSFNIVLPVTLATFKGILVQAGGQIFVAPTSSVERVTRVRRDEIATVENRETICHKGQSLAFAWLADALELPRRETKESAVQQEVLILSAASQRLAFGVEAVMHEQEVLVKPLAKPLLRVRNIAGATVLGSGTPVLILKVADLFKSAARVAARGARREAPTALAGRVHPLLVVDDSVTSRMLLKNILESAGYPVTTAGDGVDAMTALQRGDFDLVVSDIEMPRMDGFELTAKIRADKQLAELPVVLVTALGSREHHERGIDAGANAYIVKSGFDQRDLLDVIRRLV